MEGGAPPERGSAIVVHGADRRKAQRQQRRASRVASAGSQEDPEAEQEQGDARFTELQGTALHDADPQNRIDALDDLKEFDDERMLPVLVKAVSDHDATVRAAAVDELSTWFGQDAPFEPLAQAARDPDPQVRSEAIQGLANLDEDPRAMAAIQQARTDPDEDVRSLADFYYTPADDSDDDSGNDSQGTDADD
jgi:HEAT repeat protein